MSHPEPPVEYATANRPGEAARSLAAAWNVTEQRALACLADPEQYRREFDSRRPRITTAEALRQLAMRTASP